MSWQCSVCYDHNIDNKRTDTNCLDQKSLPLKDKNQICTELSHRTDNQWQCPQCTFLNHCVLSYCEICGYGIMQNNKDIHSNNNDVNNDNNEMRDVDFAKKLQAEEDEKFLSIYSDRESAMMLQQSLWSNYLNSAIKQHQKNKNLESLTALIAALLSENVSDPKQKGLKNLFKEDAIKNVRILLDQILNSSELLKYVKANNVQKTIDLVHKYWSAFAKSMQTIKYKQKQINDLILFCNKWSKILKKRQNLKNGESLSDDDVFFMKNIANTFTLWFQGDDDIDKLEKTWISLHKELRKQHIFWQQKTAEIEQQITRKMYQEQQSKSLWEWKNIFARVTKWVGMATVAVGAVVGIVFSGPIGLGVMAVGGAVTYFSHKAQKNAKAKLDKVAQRMMQLDQTTLNLKYIQDTFASMKQDSSVLEKFFDDFMMQLKSPKDDLNEINEEMKKNEECMFEVIEDNVEGMIESLHQLQKIFQDIIHQMDSTFNKQKSVVTKR